LVKRYPVSTYLALTVGLSVLVFLIPAPDEGTLLGLLLLATILPTAVAIAVTWVLDGRSGAAAFIRQCFDWRSPLLWYLVAVALGFVVQLGSSVLALLGGRISTLELRPPLPVLVVFILFALLEEIGWRGFALRRLLTQYSPFAATIVIGLAWGGVHVALAMFTLEDISPIAEGLTVFAFAFPLTWIFIRSGGSVLVATVLHFSINASGSIVGPALVIGEADAVWFLLASQAIAAVVLVVADWRRWFATPANTAAPGTGPDLAQAGAA
jgi:membrane protease YdiL (CAAX protease family)